MARGSLRAAGRLLVAAGAVVWLGGQGKPSGAVHHVAMKAVDYEPKRVAARVGDTCTCVGPPDVIVAGSSSVRIGGKPAARVGDATAHGGAVAAGLTTVLIGG